MPTNGTLALTLSRGLHVVTVSLVACQSWRCSPLDRGSWSLHYALMEWRTARTEESQRTDVGLVGAT